MWLTPVRTTEPAHPLCLSLHTPRLLGSMHHLPCQYVCLRVLSSLPRPVSPVPPRPRTRAALARTPALRHSSAPVASRSAHALCVCLPAQDALRSLRPAPQLPVALLLLRALAQLLEVRVLLLIQRNRPELVLCRERRLQLTAVVVLAVPRVGRKTRVARQQSRS